MGRLQTSIGLVTGTDIVGTVDQLIAISARPRDRLVSRTNDLGRQQTAIAELTALIIGTQIAGGRLGSATQYQARKATSSNDAALSVSASSNAQLGEFQARATRLASTHGVQSKSLATDPTTELGLSGSIQVRAGGFINSSVKLADLNQGLGVASGSIRITDRAGNTEEIDLSKAATIDDVLTAINGAKSARVKATTVGDSIRLTDISGQSVGNLRVDDVGGGETAADLGLRGIDTAVSVVTGQDIYGDITDIALTGLQGVALSSLGGGSGLGTLTSIDITTTDGQTETIDLSSATSTQDIVRLINESGLQVEAKLNDSATGFRVRDLSGGADNAFSISSSDETAAKLKLAQTSSSRVIDGGDLNRQFVTASTKLSTLRQGRGIDDGAFRITDSLGQTADVNLDNPGEATVSDLIEAINATDLSITASINSGGDGIVIDDVGGGSVRLTIVDTNGDTTASDLGLMSPAVNTAVGNATVQRINAAQSDTITVTATDSLESIVAKINEDARFATASIVVGDDGQRSIAFRSARGGDAGRLSISTAGFELGLRTNSIGADAILEVQEAGGAVRQLSSIDGVFTDVTPGVSVTAKTVSEDFASINVTRDSATAVTNVRTFVTQYNKLVDKLKELTFFSQDSNSVGLLFGSSEALRIETSYSKLLSGSVFSAGSIRGIAEIGLSFDDSGKLELSESKLTEKLDANSESVEKFLTTEDTGLVARLDSVAERLAGATNSLLINRTEALGVRIQRNNRQTDTLNTRLENERERLLLRYYAAEQSIARLQNNQSFISQIESLNISNN